MLAAGPTPEALLPYIKVIQSLIRRRPFLVKGLENTLNKFILSLEFYDENGRKTIATGGRAGRCRHDPSSRQPLAAEACGACSCCAFCARVLLMLVGC